MESSAILWQRLDQKGYDSCLVRRTDRGWCLKGTAVFSERRQPCLLDYKVICDKDWRTVSGTVRGWNGRDVLLVEIEVMPAIGWYVNGALTPNTEDCVDLDLSFTPSTNLIPVRRLGLSVGERSSSSSAWLGFPELRLERLEQEYQRIGPSTYRYRTEGGYTNELEVNDAGFVTLYPDRWESVAAAQ